MKSMWKVFWLRVGVVMVAVLAVIIGWQYAYPSFRRFSPIVRQDQKVLPRLEAGHRVKVKGATFYVPQIPKAEVGSSTVTFRPGGVLFVSVPVQVEGQIPKDTFGIAIEDNPARLTLEEWFKQNIDPDGILTAAGTFSAQALLDGKRILILTGAVPAEYDDPSLAGIYVMSPSHTKVVTIHRSQDQDLLLTGLDNEEQVHLERQIAESLQFLE